MIRRQIAKGLPALFIALSLGLPSLAMGQSLAAQKVCKTNYMQCVNSRTPSDYQGKYTCVQQFKQCVEGTGKASTTALPGGSPTTLPNKPKAQ